MMDKVLLEKWRGFGLPVAFYHTTFVENAPSILLEQKIIANKGDSICKEKNGFVSLSDRITKGIVEFFGNVVFEFDAVSLYKKNKLIAPRNYGISEDDIEKHDELPFFENEWIIPHKLEFEDNDINKVLLITSRDFRKSAFKEVVSTLKTRDVGYYFLSEIWLSDREAPDQARYFFRIENWRKFNKAREYT